MLLTKNIIILLIFLCSLSSWANLETLVAKKTSNYQALRNHYHRLLVQILDSNSSKFCSHNLEIYPKLVMIFEDDMELIGELRKYSNEDYRTYAIELEENSFSPIFAYNAYRDICNQTGFDLQKVKNGIMNHLINVDYLSLLHNEWREAYGPFRF